MSDYFEAYKKISLRDYEWNAKGGDSLACLCFLRGLLACVSGSLIFIEIKYLIGLLVFTRNNEFHLGFVKANDIFKPFMPFDKI